MRLFSKYPHFLISILEGLNFSRHLIFHCLKHFFLSPCWGLSVELSALIIASLSKFSIVNNHVFALFSPPFLVVELLLLFWLTLHSFQDLVLTACNFHFLVSLHLVDNHFSAASVSIFSLTFWDYFFVFWSQTSWGQCHCLSCSCCHPTSSL